MIRDLATGMKARCVACGSNLVLVLDHVAADKSSEAWKAHAELHRPGCLVVENRPAVWPSSAPTILPFKVRRSGESPALLRVVETRDDLIHAVQSPWWLPWVRPGEDADPSN